MTKLEKRLRMKDYIARIGEYSETARLCIKQINDYIVSSKFYDAETKSFNKVFYIPAEEFGESLDLIYHYCDVLRSFTKKVQVCTEEAQEYVNNLQNDTEDLQNYTNNLQNDTEDLQNYTESLQDYTEDLLNDTEDLIEDIIDLQDVINSSQENIKGITGFCNHMQEAINTLRHNNRPPSSDTKHSVFHEISFFKHPKYQLEYVVHMKTIAKAE
ncbi:MAG: hypothetical protein LBS54_09605 [Dysgonamonadaceae bacterium]|jgi:molecular chaperone GrpE (heat shock protein)|nr:hypothetical protein [Dysgonamonadaceae bacterium]